MLNIENKYCIYPFILNSKNLNEIDFILELNSFGFISQRYQNSIILLFTYKSFELDILNLSYAYNISIFDDFSNLLIFENLYNFIKNDIRFKTNEELKSIRILLLVHYELNHFSALEKYFFKNKYEDL